jgi:hypothetical protein
MEVLQEIVEMGVLQTICLINFTDNCLGKVLQKIVWIKFYRQLFG